jgi:hypothetical protein
LRIIDGYYLSGFYRIEYPLSLGVESVQVLVELEGGLPVDRCLISGCIDGDFFMLLQEEISTSGNTAPDVVEMEMSDPMDEFIGPIGTTGIHIVVFVQNSKADIGVVWSMEF